LRPPSPFSEEIVLNDNLIYQSTLQFCVVELNLRGDSSDECPDVGIRNACVDSGEGWVAAAVAERRDTDQAVQLRSVADVNAVLVQERR